MKIDMSGDNTIDFWFSMGSTYTYLTVMRLPAVEQSAGVRFRWRPFYLGRIFTEMNNVPFADKPAKQAYMWRDIERRASIYDIPLDVPAPYPVKQVVLANRIAYLGIQGGWGEAFVRASYRQWFQHGQLPGEEPNLSSSLRAAGQDPQRVLSLADDPATDQALIADTNEARRLGIFGSPTFVAGSELFWGDDRLDEAVTWLRRGKLGSR
jgi:2-hydroxychromene-2-carboxylate isomerase